MAGGFDVFEDVEDAAVGADDVGGARDTGDGLAVHCFLHDTAKLLADFLVRISKERIGEIVLLLKLFLRADGVAGDAKYNHTNTLQHFELVAEAAGLHGAAGGVGAGIEEEDDGFSGEVADTNGVAVLVGEGEVGEEIVDLGGHGGSGVVCVTV